jgi:hypothetical protein
LAIPAPFVTATWICSTEGKRRRISMKKMEMAPAGRKRTEARV